MISNIFLGLRTSRRTGPFGPEGPRFREQLWLLPSPDPSTLLRSILFRPKACGIKFPLAIINHGSPGTEMARQALPPPIFFHLSKWFVERGFAVLVPQRRGHGGTGGGHAETFRSADGVDFLAAAQNSADDIESAARYMIGERFIDSSRLVIVGISSGGWGSLALAARKPELARAIINFAGGRGGRLDGLPNRNFAPEKLVEAARALGRDARIPSLWLYCRNDKHFDPELASRMYFAWQEGGGSTEMHLLPDFGRDGHHLATHQLGVRFWGSLIETFLKRNTAHAADCESFVGGAGQIRRRSEVHSIQSDFQ